VTIRDVIERHGYLAHPGDPNRAGEAWEEAGFDGPRRLHRRVRAVITPRREVDQIAGLTAAGAPIDSFGVGTDLGTSRDSPVVNGIYKLVAHRVGGSWRDVRKRSTEKATVPGAKQVFGDYAEGEMRGDVIARVEEELPGRPLLVPFMRGGRLVCEETLGQMSDRAPAELIALPAGLRRLDSEGDAYPVAYSERCRGALQEVDARAAR
jgi:nicotinate phosphoribosyltransferase